MRPPAWWLVAHSYGCLASVVAAADRPERVAGLLLVAPPTRTASALSDFERLAACPDRDGGVVDSLGAHRRSSAWSWPVATTRGPTSPVTAYWADRWGSVLIDIGAATYINADSGHGPWPRGLPCFRTLRDSYAGLPLGHRRCPFDPQRAKRRLARLRHRTRFTGTCSAVSS